MPILNAWILQPNGEVLFQGSYADKPVDAPFSLLSLLHDAGAALPEHREDRSSSSSGRAPPPLRPITLLVTQGAKFAAMPVAAAFLVVVNGAVTDTDTFLTQCVRRIEALLGALCGDFNATRAGTCVSCVSSVSLPPHCLFGRCCSQRVCW